MKLHHAARPGTGVLHEVNPEIAGWQYLSFKVVRLEAGQTLEGHTSGNEEMIVFLGGSARASAGGQNFEIAGRKSVFDGPPFELYMPPGTAYSVTATTDLEFSIGGAPAEGKFPVRLYGPSDYQVEMRGGANVARAVTHLTGPGIDVEKLFLFEVYTPSGNWSGFPPHRHDGRMGSSYLEETYYFKVTPTDGFGVFRVYTVDTDLDEVVVTRDGDLVIVPEGYHPGSTAPGSNLYFLNYLAGKTREYTVVNDPAFDWVKDNWAGNPLQLPFKVG